MTKEICVIVGTRPGIIMMAPIIHALKQKNIPHYVIHTGQHYSPQMDSELFEDLDLPAADFHLTGVAEESTHATKTAKMMVGCEEVFLKRRPALVIVNGDANTNLAGSLAARKLGIILAHSEAGERSYDWRMPEEHNRRMMDHTSELLFTTGVKGKKILEGENVPGQIHVTGNPIVDASHNHAILAQNQSNILDEYNLKKHDYFLVTSHREENVDDPDRLTAILKGVQMGAEKMGLKAILPIHPRTRKNIDHFNLNHLIQENDRLITLPPLRYLDFMQMLVNARIVVTDSGGVQQESYIHKIPCVTIRDNTEWVETCLLYTSDAADD